jgi:hypothetical protein
MGVSSAAVISVICQRLYSTIFAGEKQLQRRRMPMVQLEHFPKILLKQ